MTKHKPTHTSWASMLTRCTNPRTKTYSFYGGRGIKVCERWRKFENFLADMGTRPEGTTLDRWPNKDGDYEPGNCRWSTYKEQRLNQPAHQVRWISYAGETKCLSDWCAQLGVTRAAIRLRMDRDGKTFEDALKTAKASQLRVHSGERA